MTRRRSMALGAVAVLFASGAFLVASRTLLSGAGFSDSQHLGVNRVGAATVGISAGEGTVALTVDEMAPGDSAIAALEIVNDGSIPMRYVLTSTTEPSPLGDYLTVEVWRDAACGPTGSSSIPAGADVLARAVPLGAGGEISLFGDARSGPDPGDRLVEPGAVDRLCYAIRLPRDADNGVQGLAARQVLTVYAEQAAEN